MGCGGGWQIEHFSICREWLLLILRGSLSCRKANAQLQGPQLRSFDFFTVKDVKPPDFKILTANLNI